MSISAAIKQAVVDPELLEDWVANQLDATSDEADLDKTRLRDHCREFLSVLASTLDEATTADVQSASWSEAREAVRAVARTRTRRGFFPRDNAIFLFSLKRPLFRRLRQTHANAPDALFTDVWTITLLVDELGLLATEVQHQASEEVIARQKRDLMDLSTPVIKLWEGVLALPLIGTMDSHRAQLATETLLEEVMRTSSRVVILDITGVPTVDTLVAQHLIKTVKALRLMGADGIISGIGPQIAQTMVQLGVDLGTIETKATLADALTTALRAAGARIEKRQNG